jgi:hypothetical protein
VKSRPEVDPRGIDVIHHRLLSLHGLLTRHVTGVDSRRWLQSRQWVRRAAHLLARPSDTTHTASPPAGMVTPAVAGEGAPGPVSPIRRPGASTHGGAA